MHSHVFDPPVSCSLFDTYRFSDARFLWYRSQLRGNRVAVSFSPVDGCRPIRSPKLRFEDRGQGQGIALARDREQIPENLRSFSPRQGVDNYLSRVRENSKHG